MRKILGSLDPRGPTVGVRTTRHDASNLYSTFENYDKSHTVTRNDVMSELGIQDRQVDFSGTGVLKSRRACTRNQKRNISTTDKSKRVQLNQHITGITGQEYMNRVTSQPDSNMPPLMRMMPTGTMSQPGEVKRLPSIGSN